MAGVHAWDAPSGAGARPAHSVPAMSARRLALILGDVILLLVEGIAP